MKLIVVGSWFGVGNVFKDMFGATCTVSTMGDLEKYKGWFDGNAVVLLGGGADISPSIYGHEPTHWTGAGKELSSRDAFELAVIRHATKTEAKLVGVCRGAQLLCAVAGGTLYQHVDNHAGSAHNMETKEGTVLSVSSAHHQMMNPAGTEHEMLAWSETIRSQRHIVEGDRNMDVTVEPEVVYFPKIKALAIQYHPEFMDRSDPAVAYSRDLISKYFMGA
jgi:gamma-glutamyl-gamma-aminobutyrate hydrolase PuuD